MTEQRWADLVEVSAGGPVSVGTMFGSKGLRTGKKFFAIWWHEQLVLKLPAARIEELVGQGAGKPFEPMTGRAMNGWILLSATTDWLELTAEAREFVESLQG
jgi:TfoX/Sxy family transcriptional regulator of competence genes